MNAGAAEPLHAEQDAFQPARLMGEGAADVRAAEVVGNGDYLLSPVTGQRLYRPFRHAAFLGGPGGCLGNAVFLAQHVVGHLVHTDRVCLHVLFIIGTFGHPDIDNGQLQGGVGVR